MTSSANWISLSGDLIRFYREDVKPHARGVALISTGGAAAHRAFQSDALGRMHPDNAVLARDTFYADTATIWAAPAKTDVHHGAPLHDIVQLKRNFDEKVLLQIVSPGQLQPELPAALAQAQIACAVLNDTLAPAQTQFCLRLYLSGLADHVRLVKGYEIEEELLTLLHLEKRELPADAGLRMIDLIGLFDRFGSPVDLLECSRGGHVRCHVAFERSGKVKDPVRAYSEGTPLDFLEDFSTLGLKELFGL